MLGSKLGKVFAGINETINYKAKRAMSLSKLLKSGNEETERVSSGPISLYHKQFAGGPSKTSTSSYGYNDPKSEARRELRSL